MSWIVKQEKQA